MATVRRQQEGRKASKERFRKTAEVRQAILSPQVTIISGSLPDKGKPISDEALLKYCDKNYHRILPIIAEKVHQEKVQQEKLKAVKACLNFEETSHHSESGTPIRRRGLKERLGPRLGDKGKSVSVHSDDSRHWSHHSSRRDTKSCHQISCSRATESAFERRYNKRASSRRTKELSESDGSAGGHWKSKLKNQKSSIEDDLSQPWVCEETDPFTPRIHYFDFPKTRMPSHIKTYDGSEDPEDHLKIFQSAAKTERWAMPTWCHMFNSTLTGNARVWFDDLPKESIDSYDDLKKAFLENYLQQKKCIKDPLECRDVKGALECMKISGFMHGITNPELIKRLHDKIPKSVDEIMRVTTAFLRGEVSASNRERKKSFPSWKQQEANQKQNFKKGGFWNQQRSKRKQDWFTLLTKTPKEIFALEKGKFKALPPMITPVEKQNHAKFCEFHGENNGKEQPKVTKKGETSEKDKALAILMVQPWERVARKRITQSFSLNPEFFFPPLGEDEGTEGPMIIEAEIGGHFIHRMYVDGGSALEILYEHCFSRLRPEIKNQLMPVTTPLIGFSGENGIIGRPGVRKLQAVPSTAHGMLNIPVEGGVITLKSSKLVPLECAMVSGPEGTLLATKPIIEERVKVEINPEYSEQTVMIGSTLTEEGRNKLCNLLQRNLDIFAWKPADMTGVPRHIAEHRLNVREGCSPVRQKKIGQAADRNKAIQDEVGKLVEAGIMKKVHYHDWLSNLVMVKKHDDSWRMNVGATYQRLVDKAFHKQIGRNLEVYVDDLVIKIRTEYEIIRDIEETFKTLREINMKLNPKKSTFRVEEGMFLGLARPMGKLKLLAASSYLNDLFSLPRFSSSAACHRPFLLSDLFLYCLVSIRCLPSFLLPNRRTSFSYVQAMFRNMPWDAGHIRRLPSINIQVLLKFIATLTLSSIIGLVADGVLSGLETIAHSSGINLLLFRVITPPSTRISSIPDGDLTTMKFIQAVAECSSSLILTSSCICPIGHITLPLNPIKGVVAGINCSYRISKADPLSTHIRCIQWPHISTSMIIGPSVPSSSLRAQKKDFYIKRETLCNPLSSHPFPRLNH
ncbi:reverse transcriptase domain-containing protein [Tanacetum coccineum]